MTAIRMSVVGQGGAQDIAGDSGSSWRGWGRLPSSSMVSAVLSGINM
jgi:hypothetical protein